MEDEICEDCGGIISLFDQAFVYQGRIVCKKCDKKLRGGPTEPEELLEFPELQASPIKIEQALDISKPRPPKPLPHKRKRSRMRSTLLWLSLVGWSLLCLFLIFYVPVRYESELKSYAFGVECLIVSCMVLWFLGALVLFIATTFTQKDERLKRG